MEAETMGGGWEGSEGWTPGLVRVRKRPRERGEVYRACGRAGWVVRCGEMDTGGAL